METVYYIVIKFLVVKIYIYIYIQNTVIDGEWSFLGFII